MTPPGPVPAIDDGFPEPPVRTSRDGVLETTLRASYGPVTLDVRSYATMHYEASVPGPTLVVCPGGRLIVHLVNDLGAPVVMRTGRRHAADAVRFGARSRPGPPLRPAARG